MGLLPVLLFLIFFLDRKEMRWVWLLLLLVLPLRAMARYIRALRSELPISSYFLRPRVPLPGRTILSLGPDPERVGDCYPTLYSLLDQTHHVDEIEISLPTSAVAPNWLAECTCPGSFIQIKRYPDGERRNVSAAAERYRGQDMNIIVVDDRVVYRRTIVGALAAAMRPGRVVTATGSRLERIDGTKESDAVAVMSSGGYIFNARLIDEEYERTRTSRPEFRGAEEAFTSIHLAKKATIVSLNSPSPPVLGRSWAKEKRNPADPRNYQTAEERTWATAGYRLIR
jgi:hypothetical protein